MTGSSDPLDLARSHDRAAPRPKRFYKTVDVAENGDGYVVMLDQRRLMTPGRATLTLSDRALAEAVAAEWKRSGGIRQRRCDAADPDREFRD